MTLAERAVRIFVVVALASPAVLLTLLASGSVARRPLAERTVARLTSVAVTTCVAALAMALVTYEGASQEPHTWPVGSWFATEDGAQLALLVDAWALTFALAAAVICGTVAAFSYRYLHRERGFVRYFVLYACFVLGVQLVAFAGSVEVLFAGWELTGLSSSLLVAFFHERRAPVANAMRVYAIYRVSDGAMLIAAVLIHHLVGSGSLSTLFRVGATEALATRSGAEISAIALFFLLAVACKSGLVPFSGWLPRAMEGPTPSSAVYYGALSVHAGCYLLWRAGPLIQTSVLAQALVVIAGAATAALAALSARVQTNVKSALSYATLTQVGVIVVEIGLGLRTLAFIHLLGNACLRLFQFLTAPNVLEDLRGLEGAGDARTGRRSLLYVLALEQGGLDALLDGIIVRPFIALARKGQEVDERLAGERPLGEERAERSARSCR